MKQEVSQAMKDPGTKPGSKLGMMYQQKSMTKYRAQMTQQEENANQPDKAQGTSNLYISGSATTTSDSKK